MKHKYINVVLGTSLLLPMTALQVAAQEERVLEEVLVTANKRTQSLQDIATTVNVVDASMLDDLAISEFKDIESITAGVTLEPYGTNPGISIRGAGRQGGPDPAVVVTVDGNIQVSPVPLFTTMLDVQQVEIIRGPQGTLYGKNAPVGAFNITTIKPDFDGVHGSVETTIDNFNTKLVRTGVNIPLIDDKLAMRVAALYEDTDGFIDFKGPGADLGHDNNGGKTEAARVRMTGYINDKLTMNLVLNYSDEDKGYTEGASNDGDPFDYEFQTDQDNFLDTQNEAVSLQFDYERDGYTVTLTNAYQEYSRNITRDADGTSTAPPNTFSIDLQSGRSINSELRVVSNIDGPWEYLGGLFHATEDSFAAVDVNNGVADIRATRDSESFGLFANSTYRFNERYSVTAGVRYSDDNKHLEDNTITPLGAETLRATENFYNTSASLKFQFTPNDSQNFYLSMDTAFRAGDFNPFMTSDFINGGFRTLGQEDSTAIEIGFKGTVLDRVRLGAALFYQTYKDMQVSDPAGSPQGARNVAPAAFCAFVPGGFDNGNGGCVIFQNLSFPQNIDEAVSQGIEFEFQTILADNWTLDGAISYTDIELKNANGVACKSPNAPRNDGDEPGKNYDTNFPPKVDGEDAPICNLGDTRLRGEPRWSTTLQSEYKDNFVYRDMALEYFGRSVIKHNSERGSPGIGERTTVDLTFGVANRESSGWDASLWIKNAMDKDYVRSFGTASVGVGEPRRVGLTLRKRFD